LVDYDSNSSIKEEDSDEEDIENIVDIIDVSKVTFGALIDSHDKEGWSLNTGHVNMIFSLQKNGS